MERGQEANPHPLPNHWRLPYWSWHCATLPPPLVLRLCQVLWRLLPSVPAPSWRLIHARSRNLRKSTYARLRKLWRSRRLFTHIPPPPLAYIWRAYARTHGLTHIPKTLLTQFTHPSSSTGSVRRKFTLASPFCCPGLTPSARGRMYGVRLAAGSRIWRTESGSTREWKCARRTGV